MSKKKEYINDIDWIRVFQRVPEITGLDLTLRGKAWEGRYYITTEPHPYKQDKLKIKLYDGCVWLHEQGGPSMSLPTWLTQHGGANDYKHAFEIIRGKDKPLTQRPEYVAKKEQINYVSPDVLRGAKAYDLNKCPLFRWFCTIFPKQKVKDAFELYSVTTDNKGLAVFWIIDKDGRILHDKRMRYCDNGHRDKTFGGTRKYKVTDGYVGRSYFGENLVSGNNENILVVESERTAIFLYLVTGKITIATGGKTNLRTKNDRFVCYPDKDAFNDWLLTGNTCIPWFEGWELPDCQQPENSDILDMIEWRINNGLGLYI